MISAVRAHRTLLSSTVLASASALYIAWIARAGSVFTIWKPDDWALIIHRSDPTVASLFEAFNGHWPTLLVMTYQAMLRTFGLEAHAPWLLLATVAHLVCVVLILRLVSRYAGVVVGLMAALAMLVFSQGSEDLFWTFQIGFYGALICGLVALEVVLGSVWTAWRAIAVTLALVASLMWSGLGVPMVVLVGIVLGHRGRWGPVGLVTAAYLGWTVLWANSYDPREGDVIAYVVRTVTIAGELVLGPGHPASLALTMTILAVAGVAAVRGWRPTILTVAGVVAFAVLYGGVGLRSSFDPEFAEPSRYRYPAALFAILAIVPIATQIASSYRLVLASLFVVMTAVGAGGMDHAVRAWRHESLVFLAQADVAQSTVEPRIAVVFEPSGPSVAQFLAAVDRWGRVAITEEMRVALQAHPYPTVASAMRERIRR